MPAQGRRRLIWSNGQGISVLANREMESGPTNKLAGPRWPLLREFFMLHIVDHSIMLGVKHRWPMSGG